MPYTLPLTEAQIMALERAAFEKLNTSCPDPTDFDVRAGYSIACETWISDEIDAHKGNACAQTRLSIAVTTLIGGE